MYYHAYSAIILTLVIAATFIISMSSLINYYLQITALVFIIYFLTKKILSPGSQFRPILDSVVYTFLISLVINSSGHLSSPFFFLYYFLIFALALLIEPIISIAMTITLVVFYLLTFQAFISPKDLIQLSSLALLTPFAIYIGKEYEKIITQKIEINRLKNKLNKSKEDELMFLSLIIKTHLKSVRHMVDNFMGDHDLNRMNHVLTRLQNLIDQYEDEKMQTN